MEPEPPAVESGPPVGVMLLISNLEPGGAERQVVELVKNLDRRRFSPFVCTLSSYVPLADSLPDREKELVVVPKRGKYDVTAVPRVARIMRERGVAVVHNFLFDAEVVGRLAARRARVPVVIASERNTDYRRPWLHRLCLRLTDRLFDLMIANSQAGKEFNQRTLGIAPERIRVVRNGVDVARFRPQDGAAVRAELGIPPRAPVVGMVAMFKRQKRHGDFFRAALEVRKRFPEAWFLCVGEPLQANQQGAADYHQEMLGLLGGLGLDSRCLVLGRRDDMPEVYAACDVTVLTSSIEGTPNVLLESMACGVPVVATDASDNRLVVPEGRAGFLVPVADVAALADGIGRLLADADLRRAFGEFGRDWVTTEFSTAALARRTGLVYLEALRARRGREAAGEASRHHHQLLIAEGKVGESSRSAIYKETS
jgi:glycosyltransferase involved in cell wall biosynthesis